MKANKQLKKNEMVYKRIVDIYPLRKVVEMEVHYGPNNTDTWGYHTHIRTCTFSIKTWFGMLSNKEIEQKVIEKFAEVCYDHRKQLLMQKKYRELSKSLCYVGP